MNFERLAIAAILLVLTSQANAAAPCKMGDTAGCSINGKPGQKVCLEPGLWSPCSPTVTTQPVKGSAIGKYMILTVIYAPPGTNGGHSTSTLSNQSGSTAGTTATISHSTKQDQKLLSLGSGISDDHMWFTQSGNDLVVQVIGTSAQMTIKNWYLGSANQIEQITTSDGHTLSNANVQNLVNAMATLAVPSTTTLSPSYQSALESTIAANWS